MFETQEAAQEYLDAKHKEIRQRHGLEPDGDNWTDEAFEEWDAFADSIGAIFWDYHDRLLEVACLLNSEAGVWMCSNPKSDDYRYGYFVPRDGKPIPEPVEA